MTTQKPKYAVLGNLPDELTQEISTAVEIHPPTSAVEEIDGLFIHGPTATPDLATLEHHLKAGKILTFHQPTDEHLSHMLKLVGYAPASGIPIVSAYRNAATQSSTVFQTLQTTGGIGFCGSPSTNNYYPTGSLGTVAVIPPAVSPHLTSAQTIVKNGVPPRPGLLPLITGYTGQTWGTLRVVEALDNSTLQLAIPIMPTPTHQWDSCEKFWRYNNDQGPQPQPGTALMHYSDYYVYWANGDDGTGNGPYYCLIRVDGGYFTAGKPGGLIQVSLGYYSGLFQLYPVTVTFNSSSDGSSANDWNFTSLEPSPAASPWSSNNSDGHPVNVYAPDLSLTFYGNAAGKTDVNWQWNVGKDASGQPISVNTLQLPGWGIDYAFDNSIVYYQGENWNTYQYPWQISDWDIFWTNLAPNGYLLQLGPTSSMGKVPFSQVSSWLIQYTNTNISIGQKGYPIQDCVVNILPSELADNNPPNPPGGTSGGLPTLWQFMAYKAHGVNGCTVGLNHFWFNYFYGCYDASSQGDSLDLGAIVAPSASS